MRRFPVLILIIVILITIILISNTYENGFVEENYLKPMDIEPQINIELSSDSEIYHSSEQMQLNATIESPTDLENLTVRVYGIKDNRGNFRINEERNVNVDAPGKTETFLFQMPSCYGCAGVSPGEYEIIFEAVHNGEIIDNFSKTVKLEK